MSEGNHLECDTTMGNLNRFLFGTLSFEPETDKPNIWLNKVIPLDIYHSMNPDVREIIQTPSPKWVPVSVPVSVSLYEQSMYNKFKHKFRHYKHLQKGKMLTTFNLVIDVFSYAESLKRQVEKDTKEEKKQETKNANHKENENRVLIKGQYWEKFNGFMNLRNSIYPIGEFAPRCNRCATFGVFRGLIACYIISYITGKPFQCIAELCAHCFWLYRRIQLNTTAKLRLTSEFLTFVYSPENQKHMTQVNYTLYQDIPKKHIFPEQNIWFRPYDSDQVYGLFQTIEYPKNTPQAIRSFAGIPTWGPYAIHEMEYMFHEQEKRTRKRKHEEAFASEHGMP
jgi:hypothetical protein